MTTGDCCHLPGSLCDCPGSAALSKSVEDSDIGRPQYITQVTAKDGRLLSTVIKALGAQSDGPICRICHEGGSGEGLLSPCDCTGTLGTVHKSCLEKWLSSSNTSYCELCHTEFVVERRPRPLTEWLKDPGPRNEKRTLFCDMVCFLFITPLAAISGWLCLRGAQDHLQFNSRLEAIGLIALTIALFTIYVLWTLVSGCCPGPCFCSEGRWKSWLTPCSCLPLGKNLGLFLSKVHLIYFKWELLAENEKPLPDHLLSRLTQEQCSPGCHVPGCRGGWEGLVLGQAVCQWWCLFQTQNWYPTGKCLTP
ncbi:E3 ubiquitin-protein ligase MARCHF2 isoform X1 [Melopsittacus undulatus]|uniref:E3 ubiquitin-protein ligase MARCHF2 n=2 Tax=Australaves TaxID=3073809 RepID=A0A8V5GU59_MELUD|nr:E3 ubiquitin-protein ligase MARCHF2 isoform X1 [Melopsittacus undulatus]XP_033926763.1 E3 ubiquitin-protein ligase MARCHF2 isoform X1 [Melopsittacus undulatus]